MAVATLTSVRTTARRWLPLALVYLAVGLSTAMAGPFLALFLDSAVHAGPLRVAVFLATAPVSAVIVATLVGKVSDRLPARRTVLLVTALAGCAGTTVTAFARDYGVLLGATVTLTALSGAMMPQAFAYAREALAGAEKVAMTMSALRTLFSIAWVAGPPLAAVLLQAGGFTLVYGFAAVMYAVAALVVLVALPATPAARPAGAPVRATGSDAPRLVIRLSIAVFVLTRCAGSLAVQDLALFVPHELGGDVGDAGLLLGLCAALEIPLMLGFGLLAARVPVRRLLVVGTACGLAYLLIVTLAHSIWELAAGQLLNAASIAALTGLGVTYVQDMLPRHPGRASTLFSNTFPAGTMLAGPVLGAAQHLGYRMPYAVGAVLCAAALGLLFLGRKTS
ncbi:MFS transporter [Actinoplanes sp. N902-109]|uniref:MFS transporter n=1 Tax=Actinoplanes sp. (strain N902-109) TaxID=649831 RepID=UPI0003293646|nr:MFS transporter [Actinoplanes sp. N902-109]AGL17899.1 major facilitator superfamily protein [Actinoplanes sp. N902-109]